MNVDALPPLRYNGSVEWIRNITLVVVTLVAFACGGGEDGKLSGTLAECERLSTGKADASSCAPMFRAVDMNKNGLIEQSECQRFVEGLDLAPLTPREFDQPIGCDDFPK